MKYQLGWSETWSQKWPAHTPNTTVEYEDADEGWYDHYYGYHFTAKNDEEAKKKALDFIDKHGNGYDINIWSVYNQYDNKVIMTEEDLS